MEVKIFEAVDGHIPEQMTSGSSGFDLFSDRDVVIQPGEVRMVGTNIYLEIPYGYEGQIRARSSLAMKGLFVANGVGTVDSDYRGEIMVLLYNSTIEPWDIDKGDSIAQVVFAPVATDIVLKEVPNAESLTRTDRGSGGFGSTGR